MIKRTKYILIFLTLTISFSCNIQETYPNGDMTLLFYFGADWKTNPLSLINDVIELTKNKVDISKRRVVILYDGPEEGDSELYVLDSPFEKTYRRVKVQDAGIETISDNELNMGSKDTLKSFIEYVKNKIPSSSYSLYFGGHGTGFNSYYSGGLALETHINEEKDLLLVSEIAEALGETEKIDLLVFDACLMGNIENIYEFKDKAKYIIASPENIPGPGNNYTSIIEGFYSSSVLNEYDLGIKTLESFYNYYKYTEPDWELQSEVEYNTENHKLLQMYDVDKFITIIESNGFEGLLIENIKSNSENLFVYDRRDIISRVYEKNINTGANEEVYKKTHYEGHYRQLKIESLNNIIISAPNSDLKLLSAYHPGSLFDLYNGLYTANTSAIYYNTNYENTAFSKKFPNWTNYLKSRN